MELMIVMMIIVMMTMICSIGVDWAIGPAMELMIVMMIIVMMTMICSIGSRLGHRTLQWS